MRKTAEKVTKINLNEAAGSSKPDLSRREREELEKQRAQANYQKLHAEGKTDQARSDLARLAIIKQHRAEAAARREAEKKGTLGNPKPQILTVHLLGVHRDPVRSICFYRFADKNCGICLYFQRKKSVAKKQPPNEIVNDSDIYGSFLFLLD